MYPYNDERELRLAAKIFVWYLVIRMCSIQKNLDRRLEAGEYFVLKRKKS